MRLHLSLLSLNVRNRQTRTVLADLTAAHRLVCSGFGNLDSDDTNRLLWRMEPNRDGNVRILVQSGPVPEWDRVQPGLWTDPPSVKDIGALRQALTPGKRFQFALVANPTRKIDTKTGPDGKRRNGRRVPLRRPDEQLDWLERRASQAGFTIPTNRLNQPEATVTAPSIQTGNRANGTLTVESVRFEGALVVTDPDSLFTAISTGIGPARAFGCGLLTLAQAR